MPRWPKKAGQLEPRSLIFGGAAIIFRIALKTNGCRLGALPLYCLGSRLVQPWQKFGYLKKKKQIENSAMSELWESYLLLLCARTEPLHFQKEPNFAIFPYRELMVRTRQDAESSSVIAVRRIRSARVATKTIQVCLAPAYPRLPISKTGVLWLCLNLSTFCC